MGKFSLPLTLLLLGVSSSFLFSSTQAYGSRGNSTIRGVNLGGWLVLEKWIKPSLFAGLPDSVEDEYTFCKQLGKTEAAKRLKVHRDNWVTEADFIELKNAGINHIRIPIGYWAFEIPDGEPWIWGSWDYVIKAINWAKKYGMLVMIDFHGAPGSQSESDNTGRAKTGSKFYYSDDNINMATRIIGKIAQIVKDPEYKNTVSIIELLNEPIIWTDYNYRLDRLRKYYKQAYDEVRKYNKDVTVAIHDAFIDLSNWYDLANSSQYNNVMIDTHLYRVISSELANYTCEQHAAYPCTKRDKLKESNNKVFTVVGEWSLATPKPCKNQPDFARQQIGVYEKSSSGWIYWNFKTEDNVEWSFMASVKAGYINLKKSNEAKC